MKKAIYLLAATAFLASCNQEVLIDTPDVEPTTPRAIGFETFADKATRADANNSNALNFFYPTFNVYGWKFVGNENPYCTFEDVTVNYYDAESTEEDAYTPGNEWGATPTTGWYYENIRYWDKMASKYQYSAYAPSTASDDVECTSDGVIKIGSATDPVTVDDKNLMATPAEALAYKGFDLDYMTAQATATPSTNPAAMSTPVSLIFKHLQAKLNIRIKLDDDMKTAQEVKVTEIKIHNLNDKGYYTNATITVTDEAGTTTNVPTGVTGWTTGTATADYVLSVTNEYLISPVEVEEDENQENTEVVTEDEEAEEVKVSYHNHYVLEQLLIPQTISKPANSDPQLSLYNEACIYVEYTIGDEIFRSYSPLADIFIGEGDATTYSFEGGKQYTLNITIGPKPINFTAEVTPWADAIDENLPMD